jgi:Acyltransferase family
VISGYLVSESWLRDSRLPAFLMRRSLRIFPGLTVIVLLSVLVLGPLMSDLPLRAYFGDRQSISYLWNVVLYPVYVLPGVFVDNPYPLAVNGSLWSLPVEFAMYLLTPVLLSLPRLGAARPRVVVATIAICGIQSDLGGRYRPVFSAWHMVPNSALGSLGRAAGRHPAGFRARLGAARGCAVRGCTVPRASLYRARVRERRPRAFWRDWPHRGSLVWHLPLQFSGSTGRREASWHRRAPSEELHHLVPPDPASRRAVVVLGREASASLQAKDATGTRHNRGTGAATGYARSGTLTTRARR